ncbi:unnamed protein product [Arctogadus glacialis]
MHCTVGRVSQQVILANHARVWPPPPLGLGVTHTHTKKLIHTSFTSIFTQQGGKKNWATSPNREEVPGRPDATTIYRDVSHLGKQTNKNKHNNKTTLKLALFQH